MAAFVVNPQGAVHSVQEEWVEALLQQGFRLATPQEIAAWYAAQGLKYEMGDSHGNQDEHGRTDRPRASTDQRSRRS